MRDWTNTAQNHHLHLQYELNDHVAELRHHKKRGEFTISDQLHTKTNTE
jgi:hypothetical protein